MNPIQHLLCFFAVTGNGLAVFYYITQDVYQFKGGPMPLVHAVFFGIALSWCWNLIAQWGRADEESRKENP